MDISLFDKNEIVKNLNEKGWSHAARLSKELVTEFDDYLAKCTWYPVHVKSHTTATTGDRYGSECSCTSMHDVILAPHWFEVSLKMTEVVAEYFGTKDIVLYSYNCFYSNQPGGVYTAVQSWHRDHDSDNFLAMFMYLTDVNNIEDGAHAFEERNGNRVDIFGPAGTIFFADTRQMHMGHKPKNKSRGMVWARWSLQPEPITYAIDCLSPINKDLIGDRYPTDETLRNIIRKVAC